MCCSSNGAMRTTMLLAHADRAREMNMRRDISSWMIRFDEDTAQDYRLRGIWRYRTIADDARAMAQSAPNRVCLRDSLRTVTYAGILREAEALASGLWHMGLRPGQVISFQLPNWI